MRLILPATLAALGLCAQAFAQEVLPVDGALTFEEANRRAGLPRWLSLKHGEFDTSGKLPELPANLRSEPGDGDDYFIAQLRGPVTEAQKQALAKRGIDVLDYVPNHAFVVRATKAQLAAAQDAGECVWTSPMHTAWRIDPVLLRAAPKGRVTIVGFDGVAAATITAQLEAIGVAVTEQHQKDTRWLFVANVAAADLIAVAKCHDVQWVEPEGEVTPRNDEMVWTVQSGISNSTPIWDQGLHGEGQIIGHMDGRLDVDSCFFDDPSNGIGPSHRKVVYRSGSGFNDLHGTHTAGTAVGDSFPIDGSTSDRGIAYMARIATSSNYSATSWYSRASTHSANGARLHTNSWGNDGTTAYDSHCNAIDLFQWNFEDNLVFFAETNLSSLRNPENAKNLVAVGNGENGNSAEFQCGGGVGPTADGRRKPDLLTPGCGIRSANTNNCGTSVLSGTSMACPSAAGSGALVRQYFQEGFYPTGAATPADSMTPSNALIKAVLINTCRDMTGEAGYPSNTEGWGRLVLDDALYFTGDATTMWVEDQRRSGGVTTGQTRTFDVDVLSSTRPLEVTLAFTDYPGTVNASNPVVNDLDLIVTAPGGTTYRGNVFSGGWSITGGVADAKNNVERVAIAAPQPGTWTFEVVASNVAVGPSGFALCANAEIDVGQGVTASVTIYGNGKPGSLTTPLISAPAPQLPSTWTVTCHSFVPNLWGIFVFGYTQVSVPFDGGTLLVAPDQLLLALTGGPPLGTATYTLNLPASPSLNGVSTFWQYWQPGAGGTGAGWAASRGLQMTMGN